MRMPECPAAFLESLILENGAAVWREILLHSLEL